MLYKASWAVIKQEEPSTAPKQTEAEVTADHEEKTRKNEMDHNANIHNPAITGFIRDVLPRIEQQRDETNHFLDNMGNIILAPNGKKVVGPVVKVSNAQDEAIRYMRAHFNTTPGKGFDPSGDAGGNTTGGEGGLSDTGRAETDFLSYPTDGDDSRHNTTSRSRFMPGREVQLPAA